MDGITPLSEFCGKSQRQVPGADKNSIRHELEALYSFLNPGNFLYLLESGSYGSKVPCLTEH
jgi:hypothetical protein